MTETGRSGAAQAGRLAAIIEPYVREGLRDPELRSAAGRVVTHSRKVGRQLGGEDLTSAVRRVAADQRVQDEIGKSARAIGDLALRVSRDVGRRRRGRRLRLVGAVLVLAALAGGVVALLRGRRGEREQGIPGGRGSDAEVRPAGSPVSFSG